MPREYVGKHFTDTGEPRPKKPTSDMYMSLEEIAQILGCTRERVRQIEQRALMKLRKRLRAKGINPEDILGDMKPIPQRKGSIRPED